MDGRERLGIYLNDHLMGANAGVQLFRRAVGNAAGTPRHAVLTRLSAETDDDRDTLRATVRTLGLRVRHDKQLAGWVVEKLGRLKPNGRLVRRSPLSDLIELEGLRLGVQGKQAGWLALRQVADRYDALDAGTLDALAARAGRQADELERLRQEAAGDVLRP